MADLIPSDYSSSDDEISNDSVDESKLTPDELKSRWAWKNSSIKSFFYKKRGRKRKKPKGRDDNANSAVKSTRKKQKISKSSDDNMDTLQTVTRTISDANRVETVTTTIVRAKRISKRKKNRNRVNNTKKSNESDANSSSSAPKYIVIDKYNIKLLSSSSSSGNDSTEDVEVIDNCTN